MGKYRILFINATSEIGGGDIILLDLARGLDKEKFSPLVVLPFNGPLVKEFCKSGVEVRFIKGMSVIKRNYNLFYIVFYFLNFLPTILKIKTLIRKEKISIVHTNSSVVLGGAIAARLCHIPHIWHVREIIPSPRAVTQTLVNIIPLLSDRVITMTDAIRNTFPERYRKNNRMQTIYDGIDIDKFILNAVPRVFRQEYGISYNTSLVGMVGRMVPWKGHRDFIRAAAIVKKSLPETCFVVVGDIVRGKHRTYRDELKDSVKELGLDGSVIFTGMRRDIPNILADLDCMVLPSSSPEPSGRVILESMALSVPVIATNHGGPRELIIDKVSGILVPPGNYKIMAEAIVAILKDKEMASRMEHEGQKRVKQFFSLNEHIKQIESIYHNLLETI